MNNPHTLLLSGLDGANPLGFLAALGSWRITDQIYPGAQMHWKSHAGHWAPELHLKSPLKEAELVAQLYTKLKEGSSNPLFRLNKDLKVPTQSFRNEARKAIDSGNFQIADWFSAAGSDTHEDRFGNIEGTLFDLMNAGKQYFLQTICFLVDNTSHDDLRNTLFENWSYGNKRNGMRWDLAEDRRYALRWKDPQADTTESQWGANRLGIEALPLLQTVPTSKRLQTTGFVSKGKTQTFFTWPIWIFPISINACKSLLGLTGNHNPDDPIDLSKMGVARLYRSQRIWKGKAPNDYSNFCPAIAIG